MDNDAAEQMPVTGILRDALAGIALLCGAWVVQKFGETLFGTSIPPLISAMLRLSELSLFFSFVYIFIRSLTKVIIGLNALITNSDPPLTQLVTSPVAWIFITLRGVGSSAKIGIIIGTITALIVDLIIVLSQVSYLFSVALLVIALFLIGIGFAAVTADAKNLTHAVTLSASGGGLFFYLSFV